MASDWWKHFQLLYCNHWHFRLLFCTEFNETWQEARTQCRLPSSCFSGRSENQDWRPGLTADTFSTSLLHGIYTKLDRKQNFNIFYQLLSFVRDDGKTKIATLATDWLRHIQLLFCNRWTEFNETWQEARTSTKHPLPSLCFRADRKTKIAALASD